MLEFVGDELWQIQHAMYGLTSSPSDWGHYRNSVLSKLQWNLEGVGYQLIQTPEPNLWKVVLKENSMVKQSYEDLDRAYGFVALYVDDVLAVGEVGVMTGFLEEVQRTWKCSSPEWVKEGEWSKFCGYEFTKKENAILLSQRSYIRDLLSRYEDLVPKSTPLPGTLDETPEENVQISDVRAAQTLVGELLWAACRSRPDLSFATSWLGRHVTRCPRRVHSLGRHTLGYLSATADMSLAYNRCEGGFGSGGSLAFQRNMLTLEVFSDAAMGAQCQRGHQGLVAVYGGSPVQWDSRQQPFCVLSTTESELLGYCDGLVLGESISSIVEILENNQLCEKGERVLYGDSMSGLKLLEAPDGPWRTRHLRLRSYVLRERLQWGLWKARHLPGSELASDLLTKPVTSPSAWQKFYDFMGMVVNAGQKLEDDGVEPKSSTRSGLASTIAAVSGLVGLAAWEPTCETAKVARLMAITALVAHLAVKCTPWIGGERDPKKAGPKAIGRPTADLREGTPTEQAVEKRKGLREHEPRPVKGDL